MNGNCVPSDICLNTEVGDNRTEKRSFLEFWLGSAGLSGAEDMSKIK